MGKTTKNGLRIAATLSGGLKVRFSAYAKENGMKESEVIKEGIRQLIRK